MQTVYTDIGKVTTYLKRRQPELRRSVLVLLWLGIVTAGARSFMVYKTTPGTNGSAPTHWPVASLVPHNPDGFTLLLFVHPHCPCTHASLHELAEILANQPRGLTAHVLFCNPPGTPDAWERSQLWDNAGALPRVQRWLDEEGREARRFRAWTSGCTLLYDAAGDLRFHGGITPIRGQTGPSEGKSAILALLQHGASERTVTPVFGCPLFDSPCPAEDPEEPCLN